MKALPLIRVMIINIIFFEEHSLVVNMDLILGYKKVCIGLDKENPQSNSFWQYKFTFIYNH